MCLFNLAVGNPALGCMCRWGAGGGRGEKEEGAAQVGGAKHVVRQPAPQLHMWVAHSCWGRSFGMALLT